MHQYRVTVTARRRTHSSTRACVFHHGIRCDTERARTAVIAALREITFWERKSRGFDMLTCGLDLICGWAHVCTAQIARVSERWPTGYSALNSEH